MFVCWRDSGQLCRKTYHKNGGDRRKFVVDENYMNMKRFVLLLVMACSVSVHAAVRLPSLLGDNMVLQQQTSVKLWGKSDPGAQVRITPSWDGKTVRCKADPQGCWTAMVETPKGCHTPYEIVFDDGEKVVLKNVLIGEVWLASGQSNMEQTLYGYGECPVENAADEIINAASEKSIRMFNVTRTRSYEPQEECGGEWLVPSMETAPVFSAAAWFFAKSLTRALNVPVGVVTAAAGGSMIESWMDKATLEGYPDIPTDREGIEKMAEWLRPLGLYNAMFHPVRHFTFKGILWYQGCSNVGKHDTYAERMADMVSLWRRDLGQGDIPFYYVELAPFAHDDDPDGVRGALLREAQFRAQSLIPNSAMVPTNDLVEPYEVYNVHPRGKDKVGRRLSYAALKLTYGKEVMQYSGPQFKELAVNGNEAVVSFTNIPMGLCRNHSLQGFEVAGEDRVFYPANHVRVEKRHWQVVVSSDKVQHPVAVRYCFRNFQLGNLTGANELPAVPFRTDDW